MRSSQRQRSRAFVFSTILKIRPIIDNAAASAMEANLGKRFTGLAKRFSRGIINVVKGGLIGGLTIGLINKLLSPLNDATEKIEKLLGQGRDASELAARFGTSTGALQQAQFVARSFGLSPDKFAELLTKYGDAVDKARTELQNPFAERSESTRAVVSFVNEKDQLQGFLKFLNGLQIVGRGQGENLFFGEGLRQQVAALRLQGKDLEASQIEALQKQGLAKQLTGEEYKNLIEKAVFGERLYGAAGAFASANYNAQAKVLGVGNPEKLSNALDNLSNQALRLAAKQAQFEAKDLVSASGKINNGVVDSLAAQQAREQGKITQSLNRYQELQRVQQDVDILKNAVNEKIVPQLFKIVGFLGTLVESWQKGSLTSRAEGYARGFMDWFVGPPPGVGGK